MRPRSHAARHPEEALAKFVEPQCDPILGASGHTLLA
jgi:hypothetical protein